MTNEHHAAYWCMKPCVNLDAAVIAKLTSASDRHPGNVIAINDPVRMAEEIAMLDCYSGGRIISGFVRGGRSRPCRRALTPRRTGGGLRRRTISSSNAGPRRDRSAMRGSITSTGRSTLGAAHAANPTRTSGSPARGARRAWCGPPNTATHT